MVAVYPGNGAHYGRHFDAMNNKKGDNGRILTVLLYCNPFWKKEHGGELRIHDDAESTHADIAPLHGRLVAFLCRDRCPHEVLPAQADRVACTFWYYDGARLSERCRTGEDIIGCFEGGD